MGYNTAPANLQLYAGLVDAGSVQISGAGVDALRIPGVDEVNASDYFFFQSLNRIFSAGDRRIEVGQRARAG